MKKLAVLLSALISLNAADLHADGTDITAGPWLQNVTETEFTVMWVTEGKCLSWIEIAPDDGTPFEASERQNVFQSMAGKRWTGTSHTVRMSGLQPGTSYRYRILVREVIDDSNPYGSIYGKEFTSSKGGTVTTMDYTASSCSFSMVNDMHDRKDLYRNLTYPVLDADPDFLLLNGDIVSYVTSIDTVINHTFDPIRELAADVPVVFARGNHEGRGADSYKVADLFKTPTGEFYYIFRQGPVAFVVLDGGEDKPDSNVAYSGLADYDAYREAELEWLEDAVKDPLFADAPVKVAVCHIPSLRFPDSWYSQIWINEKFNPVLNSAGVDIMLSAHHHRHFLVEAGECGNDFPILVNSNMERLDFVSTDGKIDIKVYNADNEMTHSYTFLPR